MTLLANRPIEATHVRPTEARAPRGGSYVSTPTRPATAGSYVTIDQRGTVPAGTIGGRYVSLGHTPEDSSEGRYTDRG